MFKAAVGTSVMAASFDAGKEAAAKAAAELGGVKLAFLYSSVAHDQEALLKGVKEVLPGTPVIGNTSFTGVIVPEGFVGGDDPFAGVMVMADEALTVGVAAVKKGPDGGCARKAGKEVAEKAMVAAGKTCAPDYFYMVAPPGEEEFFLKGISEVIGRVPFFGGSAADNSITGEWLLFTGDGAFADGVAVAFFYSDKKFANLFTGAYNETKNVGIITKIDGNRCLQEIDGVPAVKKYAEWTGKDADSLLGGNLLVETICAPLGVKDRLGDLVAIRHPMFANDDYSMNIGANLAVNTAVIQMETTVDGLIASVSETIGKLKEKIGGEIGAMHLVHCGGRRAGIGERINEVSQKAKETAGDIPFIMEFTFGEYGYEDDGNNTTGGLMLSFTAFGK